MAERRPEPAYLKVVKDLRRKIRDGEIPPESLLPSLPALEAQYATTNGVVRRALQELREERLIETTQGRRAKVLGPGQWLSADGAEVMQRLGALIDGFEELEQRVDAIESRLRALEP